jgi:nitroimidazol reductase NimA-like FMN-containing flavoprotein (pyridoxamine 5'-phosphate oxidase superfamily)
MFPDWPAGTVAFLATAGDDGPHAIPVSTARRAGPRTVVFALSPARGSLARLRADPRCALSVVASDTAMTLRGRAREVGEAAGVVALALDVEAVDDHRTPAFEIEAGVRWHWVDGEAERRDGQVRAALDELSG